MTKNKIIKKIQSLKLTVDEIEEILEAASITDEVVDFISNKYQQQIDSDEDSFQHVKDIIDMLDLTKYDEIIIASNLSKAAKRSFFSLMLAGQLSRLEIIYFIKYDLAKDDEIKQLFEHDLQRDLAEIVLKWKPHLFETSLEKFCTQYCITITDILRSKQRISQLEKFKFMVQ